MSNHVPEEIQLYILKYLPVESLLRSRSVCKSWKQTIDSEPFIQDHLSHQKPRIIIECEEPDFLIGYPSQLPPIDTLQSANPGTRLHLVGTLHGILCLFDEFQLEFLVWNPWLRKSFRLFNSSRYNWRDHDPDCPIAYSSGFWIDPSSKEFKIIVFRLFEDKEEDDAYEIYSSSSGVWKEVPIGELEKYHNNEPTTSIVIGNVGYWTAFYNYYGYDSYEDEKVQKMNGVVLLAFDFVEEVFLDAIEGFSIRDGWNNPVLCSRDGTLSLVYMDPEKSCDILAREEGKWVHVFATKLLPRVKQIVWADAEMGKVVAATVSGELILFDSITKVYHYLKTGLEIAYDFVLAHDFVESLIDPNTFSRTLGGT